MAVFCCLKFILKLRLTILVACINILTMSKTRKYQPHEIIAVRINNLRMGCRQDIIAKEIGVSESALCRYLASGAKLCRDMAEHEGKVAQLFKLLGLELKK